MSDTERDRADLASTTLTDQQIHDLAAEMIRGDMEDLANGRNRLCERLRDHVGELPLAELDRHVQRLQTEIRLQADLPDDDA